MLEVRNVTKRYGAITAVRNVSFTVRPGEVLGYLGPERFRQVDDGQDACRADAAVARARSCSTGTTSRTT